MVRRRVPPPDGYDEFGVPYRLLRIPRSPLGRLIQRSLNRGRGIAYRGNQVHWWWRLLGWTVFAVPLGLVRPWLAPIGVLVFELVVILLFQRSHRRMVSMRADRPR